MRIALLPLLQIGFFHARALLLFRIAFPGLVRLRERTLVGLLPWVVLRRLFAHLSFFIGSSSLDLPLEPPRRPELVEMVHVWCERRFPGEQVINTRHYALLLLV